MDQFDLIKYIWDSDLYYMVQWFCLISVRLFGPGHAKMCLMHANNKGTDQHPHSLISTFVVCCLESMICIHVLTISKVSRF